MGRRGSQNDRQVASGPVIKAVRTLPEAELARLKRIFKSVSQPSDSAANSKKSGMRRR